MIIKQPACYDLSHYIKQIQDFKLINPRPALLITKATEADPTTTPYHTDDKFVDFFGRMMEIYSIRGAYHFHRKYSNPYKQADHFISVISKMDILSTDILILDVEEGGEKVSSLWAWFETVKQAYPQNRLMLYSRKGLLDPLVMTAGEKAYFKNILIWTAGYPVIPDLYSKIPNGYIPDQTKYGPAVLWQYSGSGRVSGIDGAVDLNYIEPNFYSMLGDNTPKDVSMGRPFTTKCTDARNKFWESIGGANTNQTVSVGQEVDGDDEQTVAGVKYLHITSPISGWTKAQWFGPLTYIDVPPPPPPPPPPTITKTHDIEVFSDGSIKIDGNPYP